MSGGSGHDAHGVLLLRGLEAPGLRIDEFLVRRGEAWGILGDTGAGMEILTGILDGDLSLVQAGVCQLPRQLGLVSFVRQQRFFEEELRRDETDFLDRPDPGTPARAFLRDVASHGELIRLFNLEQVLDRGYRHLSSGESRKIGILRELSAGAQVLALEHPFDGLDQASCRELETQLARLHAQGLTLLFLCSDAADLPPWCTHLALVQDGALVCQGQAAAIRPRLGAATRLAVRTGPLFRARVEDLRPRIAEEEEADGAVEPLVDLRNGFARYGEVAVFTGLDLCIRPGEHTLITGPNGCGKSTLVQLITGDHPLCYANDLSIFGTRRGSGESIWEVKRQMGIVSNDLHRNHRVGGTALAIVLSGLFDSIGLYARPTESQRSLGRRWLSWLGLKERASHPFRRLSYGEQRLVLLGRALIKQPRLLLLDEPTQGLDSANRRAFLDFLERAAAERLCTTLYISHRQDERRPFFRQHLHFVPGRTDQPFRLTPADHAV